MMIKKKVYSVHYYKYVKNTHSSPPHTDRVLANDIEDAIDVIKEVCKEKDWKDFKIYGIEASGDYVWVGEN